ncbi:hypothetical protein BJX64DRAFT_227153 [Aspergillus heterothallicus]
MVRPFFSAWPFRGLCPTYLRYGCDSSACQFLGFLGFVLGSWDLACMAVVVRRLCESVTIQVRRQTKSTSNLAFAIRCVYPVANFLEGVYSTDPY